MNDISTSEDKFNEIQKMYNPNKLKKINKPIKSKKFIKLPKSLKDIKLTNSKIEQNELDDNNNDNNKLILNPEKIKLKVENQFNSSRYNYIRNKDNCKNLQLKQFIENNKCTNNINEDIVYNHNITNKRISNSNSNFNGYYLEDQENKNQFVKIKNGYD